MSIPPDAEVAGFRAEGGLVPEVRPPPDELERLQSLATRPVADNPHLGGEPVAPPNVPMAPLHVPSSRVRNVT